MSERVWMEVMSCKCGRGCITIGDRRITDHKCTGQWEPYRRYSVSVDELRLAADTAPRVASRAPGGKGGGQ